MLPWTGYKVGIKSCFIFFLYVSWQRWTIPIHCFASVPTVLFDFIAIICNCIYPLLEWQFGIEVSRSYQTLVSESNTKIAGWRSYMELWNVVSYLSSCVSVETPCTAAQFSNRSGCRVVQWHKWSPSNSLLQGMEEELCSISIFQHTLKTIRQSSPSVFLGEAWHLYELVINT